MALYNMSFDLKTNIEINAMYIAKYCLMKNK